MVLYTNKLRGKETYVCNSPSNGSEKKYVHMDRENKKANVVTC